MVNSPERLIQPLGSHPPAWRRIWEICGICGMSAIAGSRGLLAGR